MKFLEILLCAALLFVGTAKPARADEASKQAKTEELFNVMHLDQMVPQMTQQMMAQVQQMMANQSKKMNLPPDAAPMLEEVQKRAMAMVNDRMNWQKLRPLYVKVYGDTFTEEEIGGIIDFYKTPAGQAFLKKTPLLTQNVMQATQGIVGDMMAEISKVLNDIYKQSDRKPRP